MQKIFLMIFVLVLTACQSIQRHVGYQSNDEVVIHRDQYGTPHVFSDSNYGAYYGYGYALASDRLYQMEMLKRTVLGRVSEVLGGDYLQLDTHIRTAYDLHSVRQQLSQLSDEDTSVLQGYADGFNRKISFSDVTWPFLKAYLFKAFESKQTTQGVADALALLKDWDMDWIADHDGNFGAYGLIVESWLSKLLTEVIKDDVGDEMFHLYSATNNPNNKLGASKGTPPGIKIIIRNLDKLTAGEQFDYDFFNGANYDDVLQQSFIEVINELTRQHGGDVADWRIKAHPMQWRPYNFRGVVQAKEDNVIEARTYMNRGSENNLFIAGDNGFKAYDVIAVGQSGYIDRAGNESKHYRDQIEMFSNYTYKPVPFTRAEVEQNSVNTQYVPLH